MSTYYEIYAMKKEYGGKRIDHNSVRSLANFIHEWHSSKKNEEMLTEKNHELRDKFINEGQIEDYKPTFVKYSLNYDGYVAFMNADKNYYNTYSKHYTLSVEEYDHLINNGIVLLEKPFDSKTETEYTTNFIHPDYRGKNVFWMLSVFTEGLNDWFERHDYYWNSYDFGKVIEKADLQNLCESLRHVLIKHNDIVSDDRFPNYMYEERRKKKYYTEEYYETVLLYYSEINAIFEKYDSETEELVITLG